MPENHSQSEQEEAAGSGYIYSSAQRSEYFSKLESWLLEAYAWHSFVAAFPYILATSQTLHGATPVNSNLRTTVSHANINTTINNESRSNTETYHRRLNEPVAPQVTVDAGIVYRIPPIWKRFVAEFIDSMLLFVLKLSITIAVDVFDFIDIEQHYFDILQLNLRVDYKMAVELTYGILILELIHRIVVCIFEASWLQRGTNGRVGGATPGKSIMHLKVVQCQNVTPTGQQDEEVVVVVPGTDLGLMPALGRSVLKNVILAFFFPICFALCIFRFNRAVYDLACNSIVVEDTYRNGNNNINNNNNNNNNVNNNNINNGRIQ